MKSLIISADYPLPENSGNRMRTMHFVRALKRHGTVDFLCYKPLAQSSSDLGTFRNEYYVELKKEINPPKHSLVRRVVDKYINCKPWIVQNFTEEVVRQIHDMILAENYDVILCRYSVNADPLLTLPDFIKKKVILDIDDLMSDDLYDAVNGDKKGLVKLKTVIDKILFHRYQNKCLSLGETVFCSETDLRILNHGEFSEKMHVVPNIIPKQVVNETYQLDGYGNDCLLFVGSLSYQPNVMGIQWFIREIFNKLPEKFNNYKLMVVGKDPREELKRMCLQHPRIELIENPPDVVPYLERCSVVLVPLLVGGGTRIKILEAGNCCRPVITTRLGAHGLDLKEYESILYFENLDNFLDKMSWLSSKSNYDRVTKALAEIVKAKYTEDNFVSSVDKIVESIMT